LGQSFHPRSALADRMVLSLPCTFNIVYLEKFLFAFLLLVEINTVVQYYYNLRLKSCMRFSFILFLGRLPPGTTKMLHNLLLREVVRVQCNRFSPQLWWKILDIVGDSPTHYTPCGPVRLLHGVAVRSMFHRKSLQHGPSD
jgi:hypothetical protein